MENIFQISCSSVICFKYQTRWNIRQFVQLISIVFEQNVSDKFFKDTQLLWRLLEESYRIIGLMQNPFS